MKIVRVDFKDCSIFDGTPILDTYYLIDPDEEKLKELKRKVETRFDYEYDNTLSEEEYEYMREIADDPWGFIDLFVELNFKTLNIDEVFEIDY